MINDKKILAIITARGGSKGIPRKNIKLLAGKPLIAWTIEEAKKSKYIDRLILSSEDDEIIKVAKEWGCEVPFVRPKELAKDETKSIDVVLHAIQEVKEKYNLICLLQPTSPLRTYVDIDNCLELSSFNAGWNAVSVTEVDKDPLFFFEHDGAYLKANNLNANFNIRRQDLNKKYYVNGAIYINDIEDLMYRKAFITFNTIGYIMPKIRSIDIDNMFDFDLCEFIINRNEKSD